MAKRAAPANSSSTGLKLQTMFGTCMQNYAISDGTGYTAELSLLPSYTIKFFE